MAASDRPTASRRAPLCLFIVLLLANPLSAQAPGQPPTSYSNSTTVRIPFQNLDGRIKQVNLFVATDVAPGWKFFVAALPSDGRFRPYTAPEDGTYLFAVQAVDHQGQPYPATLDELVPQVRVVVDRKAPSIFLRPASGPEGQVGVEWELRDEHLDLKSFTLRYRIVGQSDWYPEPNAKAAATGSQLWTGVQPGQRIEVQLNVSDLARNAASETTTVTLGADGRADGMPSGSRPGVASDVTHINGTTFSIPYRITKVGPSGLGVCDLWCTKDGGRTWFKVQRDGGSTQPGGLPANPGEGAPPPQGNFVFKADGEGQFGFLVVARNVVGIGDHDPKQGDLPRIKVEVDLTKPRVTLHAQAGRGQDVRNVTLRWAAEDKNLTDKPVALQYAEVKGDAAPVEGDWKPLPAMSELQGPSGGYTWTVGREGPFKFHVRATAVDKAGNVGSDMTKVPIVVDLEAPRVELDAPRAEGAGGVQKLPER